MFGIKRRMEGIEDQMDEMFHALNDLIADHAELVKSTKVKKQSKEEDVFTSNKIPELRKEFTELRKAHIELRDYCIKLTDDMNTWAQSISAQLEQLNKEKTK